MVPRLRFSTGGFVASGIFLFAAASVFYWIFFVASGNPADSGESGILLVPFAMPWISIIPDGLLGPAAGLGCIVFNAFILYCIFGGLRLRKSKR